MGGLGNGRTREWESDGRRGWGGEDVEAVWAAANGSQLVDGGLTQARRLTSIRYIAITHLKILRDASPLVALRVESRWRQL